MRTFIAIDLGEQVQRGLGRIQNRLRGGQGMEDKAIRWVQPELIHLTVKFLGEVRDDQITDVCAAVDRAAAGKKAFELTVSGIGCFPERGAARVLWAGLEKLPAELVELQAELEQAMAELGFEPEGRAYSPHLTLARIKAPKAGHVVREAVAKEGALEAGGCLVDRVVVFESVLGRGGAVYTPMHEVRLG